MLALGALSCNCAKVDVHRVQSKPKPPPPPPTPGPFGVWSDGAQSMTIRPDSSAQWVVDAPLCYLTYHYVLVGRFQTIADSLQIAGTTEFRCAGIKEGDARFTATFDPSFTRIMGEARIIRYACCGDYYPSDYSAP